MRGYEVIREIENKVGTSKKKVLAIYAEKGH